jgi:predicted kinase
MSGFPGSGKSTLAKQIAKRTNAVIIDHDVVKSAL